jgi:DNA-directed RNA polymerase specialized sigma24 family protein
MSSFHSQPGRRTNEDVFFVYHRRLLGWAIQITHGDRSDAEDLVQDLYLRVTRITRRIDEMEQPEGYLFRVLRNLYIARVRRSGRDPLNDLSIVDYDFVGQGLAVVDRWQLLFVRDDLRTICRYACERKGTVRSASVLILRFFHGYYPSEVMKIVRAGRPSVDMSLQAARNEARLSLERPEALRCILPTNKPSISFSTKGEDTQGLFAELQGAIFSAAEGECFDRAALERLYAAESGVVGLTTQELSHLVSCRACLDAVNVILHLPLLAERSPENGIDRDGSGSSRGAGITPIRKKVGEKGLDKRKLERRARELFEHRPASLEIAVDGRVRTSQRVTAEINELHLRLAHKKEEAFFIEIFSEQRFCMIFLQVEEPSSADKLEQAETVLLSDGRSLSLTLRFAADGPIVHVLYRDPVTREATAEQPSTQNAVDATSGEKTQSAGAEPGYLEIFALHGCVTLWTSLRLWFSGLPGNLRIFGMLAASMCVLLAVIFLFPQHPERQLLPTEVLQQVIKQEQAPPANAAVHSVFSYQEEDAAGHLQQTGQIDSWRQTLPRQLTLRFYDAQHVLVSGFVQNLQGSVGYGKDADTERLLAWHDIPSAEAFATLLPSGAAPEGTQSGDEYRMVVHSPSSHPELVEAVLIIDRRDMRAVEADYDIHDAQGLHHVRLSQVSYEVRSADGFDHDVFDVGRDFDRSSRSSSLTPQHLDKSVSNTVPLALQVLTDLMQSGVGVGEQVEVHRDRKTGMVEVCGVMDTLERKAILLKALSPLARDPHLTISLYSTDELPQLSLAQPGKRKRNQLSASPSPIIPVDTYQATSSKIPADGVTRSHLDLGGLSGHQLDIAVRSFAGEACSESLQAQQHAYRLAELTGEFTPADLAQLDTASRLKWLMLVENYSEALDSDLKSLQSHLRPVLGAAASSPAAAAQNPPSPLTSPEELAAASRNILSQTTRLNEQVQSTFSLTAVSRDSQPNPSPAGDDTFAEITQLLESAKSMAANASATAQHLQLFATSAR